jgi:hypothetical protein
MIEVSRNNLVKNKKYYIHRNSYNGIGGKYIGIFIENEMIDENISSKFKNIVFFNKGKRFDWGLNGKLTLVDINENFIVEHPSYIWKFYEYNKDNILHKSFMRQKKNAMIKFIDINLNNRNKNIDIESLDGFCCDWFDKI